METDGCVKTLLLCLMVLAEGSSSAAPLQNFCTNGTVLRTRVACHSCSISALRSCPAGFGRSPGSLAQDCTFHIRTSSLRLPLPGCSFECYREVEVKSCCPGFWGPDCAECPERADSPCSGNGACSDGLGGTGVCSCQPGFVGTACEDCTPGRFGPTCSSECACVHGLCDSGRGGSGRCTCFSGYSGAACDRERPECAALGCLQNSRCVEEAATGLLRCQCLHGYQRSGQQCLPLDPCVQKVCHAHAACVHTGPGQHACTCNRGYSGDGRVCVEVDPCQSQQGGCSAATQRCVHDGPGASHCECLPGFQRLHTGACVLKEACQPNTCHRNANCTTVGPATPRCTCRQGYVGNGKVCYGNIMERLQELNAQPGGAWSGQLSAAIGLFSSVSWPLQNLGPFTAFVPINKAFRGTPVKSLTADPSSARYLCQLHLVAGVMTLDTLKKSNQFFTLTGKSAEVDASDGDSEARLRLHGSRKKGVIVQAGNVASNGVIHLINKLMDSVAPIVQSDAQENVGKIVSDYGKFGTLRSLLEKAELQALLDLPGPITVFAPVSSAFDLMGEGHLTYLRSAEGHAKLVELLRNHVVPSVAVDVFNMASAPRVVSLANQVLTVNVSQNGQLLVGGAAVLEAAVEAKNGRLYVMDGVLVPPSIVPVLPHRCDVTETRITKGECVSCTRVRLSRCPSGLPTGFSTLGCVYTLSIGRPALALPAKGCSSLCNTTVTTPACCRGFYGPDCSPCPGGHQNPCSGHGQCSDGIGGDGTCACQPNFAGSRCQYCSSSSKHGPGCDRTCPCVHGQCDNRPDSDGSCKADSCLPGFTGRLCDRRTAACGAQAQFCHAHADCDFSQGAVRCVCKPGFQGDGITCVESDPCAPPHRGGCSLNAKCIKTGVSSHVCQCLSGWRQDGDECQPVNRCQAPERGGCHPNASCIYVGPGQSDCSCKGGYKGNGLECEPLHPCVTAEGSCHYLASCLLVASQWTCVCDEGYVGDGRVCYGSVQKELMFLQDASEFFGWTSAPGASEALTGQNLTLLVPSSAAVAKMSSEDTNFWTAQENLPSLLRNHVIPGVHPWSSLGNLTSVTSLLKTTLPVSASGELVTVGGAAITTTDIAATNGLIHMIDRVLVPDRRLSEGLLATLALRPEFSLFRSYLAVYNLSEEIQQAGEFTLFAPTDAAVQGYLKRTSSAALDVNTTRYHMVPAERLLKTDLQAGGYKPTMLGFSFQLRIFPRDGKLLVNDVQIDSSNVVSGSGVIHGLAEVLDIVRNRCDETKYLKFRGPCVDCLFSRGQLCPNDTVPDKSVRTKKCLFSHMFESERLLTIGCRTTCLRKNLVHRCCQGFFGEHCQPCPGPGGRPCYGNGVCVDGINGTGLCQCHTGFSGTACETCQDGKYGVHCDQDCACKGGRCSAGVAGDGTCECDVGWKGVLCQEKIDSPDDLCGSIRCHTSANCVTMASGFRCLCAAGFTGNGTHCQARDACAQNNGGCSVNAVCKRTLPGKRACVCHRGFSGDGLVCVEINACLQGRQGCHVNADCLHVGPNRTSCVCHDGYHGDGRSCQVTDLCLQRNGGCSENARCNMSAPGVRTCTCSSNYVGDGLSCRGTVAKELLKKKLRDFYLGLMMMEIPLKGRGPFTVFAPSSDAFDQIKKGKKLVLSGERFATILRSHIVMCHTLLPVDLSRPRNLTSLSGLVLSTSSSQGHIFINQANVTYSNEVSINGIFHVIDRVLVPPDINRTSGAALNLSDVAEHHGYKKFYKLLEDSGVVELLKEEVHQPVTLLLPSDQALASLPPEQKDFLFHRENRPQLLEYLKFHVLPAQKVYAEDLVHLASPRTLQGSPLSFRCGGTDAIGEIFVDAGACRVVQRHLSFAGGMAYGIDCLLTPPSLGGRCDTRATFDFPMACAVCSSSATRCPPGSRQKEVQKCDLPSVYVTRNSGCRSICAVSVWQSRCCHGYYGRDCLACPGGAGSPCSNRGKCDDGHLGNGTCACEPGFGGVACELCREGFYGAACEACDCAEHGSCDGGRGGTGACFCDAGWRGPRCDRQADQLPECSPACSPNAVCQDNNTCVCRPSYQGDGLTCTGMDRCQVMNGGCAATARCSQSGERVSCRCASGYGGDGYVCTPLDPCASGDNGGCHQHATCTMTAPGKRKCSCKQNFIGDGLVCEPKQLPVSRCLQDNGGCHLHARCSDLHAEDAHLGVFHQRSDGGQYKLNYTSAQQLCAAQGASLASYSQLSYAQQAGMNMCAAGWLDQARVAYPTTYSNPLCGFGHVGVVDYGPRRNLSETWDAFCYRMKEVSCACGSGYVGDGLSCSGSLLQVLQETPGFSNFLSQILNCSQGSAEGRRFLERLSDLKVQSTLFVPDNSGLPGNQTLSQRDIEFHLSEGGALPAQQLKNGTRLRTRVGRLSVLQVADMLEPASLSSFYVNRRFVTAADVLASNGIIHVLQGPLEAPPPATQQVGAAHGAGIGVGVVLLVSLAAAALLVGRRFYSRTAKPFRFHYFKEEEEEPPPPEQSGRSICNPVYESDPEPAEDGLSQQGGGAKADGGVCDLLADS